MISQEEKSKKVLLAEEGLAQAKAQLMSFPIYGNNILLTLVRSTDTL